MTFFFVGKAQHKGNFGNKIEKDVSKTTLSQPCLVKRVGEALGVCNTYSTVVSAPDECDALPRHVDNSLQVDPSLTQVS